MKDTKEILRKVRRIEIKTKGLTQQIFSGEYHSAFKGRGMAFSEVREYTPGDDIRTIDWNVTARFNHPYVKVFEEERELTVMLMIDVSASSEFGTRIRSRSEFIAELTAVIGFSALQNNDKVGAILFSDKIERFIPPKKGRSHALRIISEVLSFKSYSAGTNLSTGLKFLTDAIRKRSICFMISDLIDPNNFSDALRIAGKKHDLVTIRLIDEKEKEMPSMGWLQLRDPETGSTRWANTSSSTFKKNYRALMMKKSEELKDTFRRSGVDLVEVPVDGSYVQPLMRLFKQR